MVLSLIHICADLDKAEKEVMAAIEAGVNYFDTAYVYAGNEVAVGEILHRNHCREKINLATKLPHYLIKSIDKMCIRDSSCRSTKVFWMQESSQKKNLQRRKSSYWEFNDKADPERVSHIYEICKNNFQMVR